MLLDEDPAALIRECIFNFNTAPDRQALGRVQSTLSTLSQHREHTLAAQSNRLRNLRRHLTHLQQQQQLSLESHDPASHAENILRLDREKFRLAKEASDLEIEGERLDGEVRSLEGEIKELERGGGRRRSEVMREEGAALEALKLKLYRSLGVELDESSKKTLVRAGTKVEAVDRSDTEGIWKALS